MINQDGTSNRPCTQAFLVVASGSIHGLVRGDRNSGPGYLECGLTARRNQCFPRSSSSGSHGFDAAHPLDLRRCDVDPLLPFRMWKVIKPIDQIRPIANCGGLDGVSAGQGVAPDHSCRCRNVDRCACLIGDVDRKAFSKPLNTINETA